MRAKSKPAPPVDWHGYESECRRLGDDPLPCWARLRYTRTPMPSRPLWVPCGRLVQVGSLEALERRLAHFGIAPRGGTGAAYQAFSRRVVWIGGGGVLADGTAVYWRFDLERRGTS